MMNYDIRILCLLSLHRALLGKVFSKLRLGAMSIDGENIGICWVVDSPLSDEEEDLLSEVETELLSDLPKNYRVNTQITEDIGLPNQAELFFKRYEGETG